MLFLGHMGIGTQLVKSFTKGLPRIPLFLGTVLPDLIDKPLYYSCVWIFQKQGADLEIIRGTRSFGHTALFLILITLVASFKKSRWIASLSLGIASHLVLDSVWINFKEFPTKRSRLATSTLIWPFDGVNFAANPYTDFSEHISNLIHPFLLGTELLGLIFLVAEFKKQSTLFPFSSKHFKIRGGPRKK